MTPSLPGEPLRSARKNWEWWRTSDYAKAATINVCFKEADAYIRLLEAELAELKGGDPDADTRGTAEGG